MLCEKLADLSVIQCELVDMLNAGKALVSVRFSTTANDNGTDCFHINPVSQLWHSDIIYFWGPRIEVTSISMGNR